MSRIRGIVSAKFWPLIMPTLLGCWVVVIVALGVIYYQQTKQQGDLEAEIPLKERVVNSFQQRAEVFQGELTKAEADLQTLRGLFSTRIEEENVYMAILNLAESARVDNFDIGPLTTRLEKVEGISYNVATFQVNVEGDYSNVVDFFTNLDSRQTQLGSLVVERLELSVEGNQGRAIVEFGIYVLK